MFTNNILDIGAHVRLKILITDRKIKVNTYVLRTVRHVQYYLLRFHNMIIWESVAVSDRVTDIDWN